MACACPSENRLRRDIARDVPEGRGQPPAPVRAAREKNCCESAHAAGGKSLPQRQEESGSSLTATYICRGSAPRPVTRLTVPTHLSLHWHPPCLVSRCRQSDGVISSAIVKRFGSQLLLVVCALFASAAFATTQSIDEVQAAAEAFVRSRLPASQAKQFVTATKLDPRLRVALCEQPLQTFEQSATARGERVTVGVRCAAANSWTLYVPVS